MARFALRDREWARIAPLLPDKPRGLARTNDRRVLNGFSPSCGQGRPWRDLPKRYGPYTTAYNQWAKAGQRATTNSPRDSSQPSQSQPQDCGAEL
ncbi:transposase [Paracoccus versutus]|nr:transposase [Paracoccus versutus]